MCTPTLVAIGIGAAIGAGTAAATGQDPLLGAIIGGATGGMNPGFLGVSAATTAGTWATVNLAGVAVATGVSYAGSSLMKAMTPETPDYSQFGQGALPYETSSQHAQVTGSGGRQAAAVLASEIKQAKSLRKRQAEASESFGLSTGMAETGLQIA